LSDEQVVQIALDAATSWYESKRARKTGNVNFNVMATGLAISVFLRTTDFPLKDKNITATNGAQVKGLNAAFVQRILDAHGVRGRIPVEGGRTSRGTITHALEFAHAVNRTLEPYNPSAIALAFASDALEDYFVDRIVVDYLNKQKLSVSIDATRPVSSIVADIISAARDRGDKPTGTVVQHLVGAKLELRFPELQIGRDRANAADQQTNRPGDFLVGTTAFHVTMNPATKLLDRVRENIRDGYRPMVLVPEDEVDFARGLFRSEQDLQNRVGVQSIETFVGTNVEEMSLFDSVAVRRSVALLVRMYNERIEQVEADMSLRIVEPRWFGEYL
jgi:hypothetical protein